MIEIEILLNIDKNLIDCRSSLAQLFLYQYTPYPSNPPINPVAPTPALMKAGLIRVAKYVANLSWNPLSLVFT